MACTNRGQSLNFGSDKLVKVKNPIPLTRQPTRQPTRRPTRRPTHHRHTTDASVDTLPTRRPTHYSFIKKLTFLNSYFVTSFSWKQEQRHQKGRKHES